MPFIDSHFINVQLIPFFLFSVGLGGAKPVPTTLATGAGEVSSDVSTLLNFFVKVEGFVETCDRTSVGGDDFSLDKTRCFGFDFVSNCCRYLFFFVKLRQHFSGGESLSKTLTP
jgi:hypothetical protein